MGRAGPRDDAGSPRPDRWQQNSLSCKTKYVRILRRTMGGRWRWYTQLVQQGLAPRKERRPLGKGVVALDVGPSTIAAVSDGDVTLELFCPGVADHGSEIRRMERAMDRSRRATNPDNYHPNGVAKKGARKWYKSSRYRILAQKKADRERRLAAERRREHGELSNRMFFQGNVIKLEKVSYRSFQKNYGRSVKRRSPGGFVSGLKRKAASAGAHVLEFSTRTTRLSQFDHTTGQHVKKPLSQRWHVFGDGSRVQRDLYSAYLARFVDNDRLDASQCVMHWAAAEPLLERAASSYHNLRVGAGFPLPNVRVPAGVQVRRSGSPVGERSVGSCEAVDDVAQARATESVNQWHS